MSPGDYRKPSNTGKVFLYWRHPNLEKNLKMAAGWYTFRYDQQYFRQRSDTYEIHTIGEATYILALNT